MSQLQFHLFINILKQLWWREKAKEFKKHPMLVQKTATLNHTFVRDQET